MSSRYFKKMAFERFDFSKFTIYIIVANVCNIHCTIHSSFENKFATIRYNFVTLKILTVVKSSRQLKFLTSRNCCYILSRYHCQMTNIWCAFAPITPSKFREVKAIHRKYFHFFNAKKTKFTKV